jgi:signal transduction histidine kinase
VQRHKRRKVREKLELENKLAKVEFEKKISDEKLRISRELHDNIGSNLTFMVSTIDNLTYTMNNKKDISKLNKLSDFGRSTLNELRQTIWAMKKREGTLSELMFKLNELKKQIPSSIKIEITNETTSEVVLTAIQTLNYFRVIQESIQNTIKYANAKNINVHFSNSINGLQLTITDDGCGFDLDMAQLGNGISNMKFRCEEVGGDFSISSNKSGTKIICNIPIK